MYFAVGIFIGLLFLIVYLKNNIECFTLLDSWYNGPWLSRDFGLTAGGGAYTKDKNDFGNNPGYIGFSLQL